MSENGEEKLLAVARHIAKTLGHNNTMSDDIFQILSNFDGRFSRENLSEKSADADSRACAALDHSLKSLDRRISHYVSSDRPIWADAADSAAFLDAVDELVAAVAEWNHLASDKSVAACLVRAEDMLQHAMFRLEDEFRSLMERGGESFGLTRSYRNGESTENLPFESEEDDEEDEVRNGGGDEEEQIPVALPVTDFDIVIDALPSGTINDLHEIAKRMVAGGFGKECSHVYSSCRREFLEESLSRLGLQKLSIEEVHKMTWQDLEDEIEKWIKASNVALKILFPSERRLCDRVFFGFASAADFSFMEVCRGSAIQLLNFADAVAIGSRSPERLFKILDVFETLRDLIPEFEALFSDQFSVSLRNEAITIWKRLGEAIRGIFMELENLIRRDPAKMAVPGGGRHPITRYVVNYLRAACRSRQTLEQVFEDYGLKEYPKLDDRVSSPASPLSVQMDWIMELLESNLEAKSKIYDDPALGYVFLMNNGRYIVQKTKDSELGTLLGDDWIRKHAAKVRQFHVHYQRSSWKKILGILKPDSNGSMPPNGLAKSMKEKLKSFNTLFDKVCREQSSWFVFDEQLREEIRISLEEILLPAYGKFVGSFQNVPELGKHADKYIKYGTEEIQARLTDLFQGSGGSTGSRKFQLALTDVDATIHDPSEGASAGLHVVKAQCSDNASMMQQLMA
ncbi:Exocyst complex component EXO70B1, partial [Mucuna pruriens]